MIIKGSLSNTIRDSIHDKENAKDFLDVKGEFLKSDKTEITNLRVLL